MIKKIEYEDKVAIQNDESVAEINKVVDTDMNEIKQAVNNNADELTQAQKDIQTNTESIEQLKEKDTTQDSLIEQLQTKVVNLEAENTSLKNQIPSGEATGNPIHLTDSSDMECEIAVVGNSEQETGDVTDEEGNVIGASPSPDYPSEIVTVGSNINLLENKAITQTINGVTFTVNKDGSVMVNGTATTNTTFKINDDIVPKNISNLILSGCPNNGSKSTYDLKIELYKNGVWTKVLYDFGNGVDTEDLSEYTSCIISTTIRKDYNANNLIFKPKLEKGTVATPYSPYGQGSVEIKQVNKNFLDLTKKPYDENSSLLNGAKVTLKGGVLNVDATNSTGAVTIRSIWADYKRSSTILLPKGTYYTSLLLNLTGVESLTSKQVGGGVFTIEEDHYLTQWFFSVAQGNKSTKILQIEKGETATNYIPHESYTKVLPIQEEMLDEDYISDKEYHNWEKIESYNGEEITTDFKSTTGELTTGATVYYKLAEPKELELTEEQKAVLNSFYTYKGITNISVDGIATLKVNYKKDLETIINKLSATSVAE